MRALHLFLAASALLLTIALTGSDSAAGGLPLAGTDRLPIVATADVGSRLGDASVALSGWVEVERGEPFIEDGVQVVDVEVVRMELIGASPIGIISASLSATPVSSGQIRSLQPDEPFPASSFFDVFLDVTVPANPPAGATRVMHNAWPIRLTPREAGVTPGGTPLTPAPAIPVGVVSGGNVTTSDLGQLGADLGWHDRCYTRAFSGNAVTCEAPITQWPPLGVAYEMFPIFGVDNDGDGSVDDDTADEDGDRLVDEDRPGVDPDTAGNECGTNPDCDALEGEDPPLTWCDTNNSPICNDDADGYQDEDPDCIPLLNSNGVNSMKHGFCVRELDLEFAPKLPSYSVARGGPSGLHPADVLGLVPLPGEGPPPEPLSFIVCNDDFSGLGLQSQVSFSATAGTTYQIQVGSYSTTGAGALVLNAYETADSPPTTAVSGNDNFANAWTIPSLPFEGSQSTLGFTTETGEPTSNPCPISPVPLSKTAWYRFTAPTNSMITVNTAGSNFDTVLMVYTGSSFGGTTDDTQAPFVRIPCSSLGLTTEGCSPSGPVDDLDALSYGSDLPPGEPLGAEFSVAPGAQGLAGTAVRTQRDCAAPEPEPDVFGTAFTNTNSHVFDGNGPVGACSPAFPLGLIESALVRDDLDALDGHDPDLVDPDYDGIPEDPVYFSLDPDSPSLSTFGFSAGDVLRTVNGAAPTVFASRSALGLASGDDLDALCLRESGNGMFDAGDLLYLSLAPGSPTLSSIGAGAGDLLAPGFPPTVVQNATSLGLQSGDDVNALACQGLPPPKDPDGDTDKDGIPNSEDPDKDGDGCLNTQELGPNPVLGGLRDPHNFWDFFDVPVGTPPARDGAATIGDVAAVVARFGATQTPPPDPHDAFMEARYSSPPSAPAYHAAYDRGGPISGQNLWNLLPPDGSIAIGDVAAAVAQFGHSCA